MFENLDVLCTPLYSKLFAKKNNHRNTNRYVIDMTYKIVKAKHVN